MFSITSGLKTILGGIVITASLSAFAVTSANAQQMCGKRTDVVQSLSANYKESTAGVGLVNNGTVVEVLTSKKGTWTILVTRTDGVACVVATGDAWESVDLQIAEGPSA